MSPEMRRMLMVPAEYRAAPRKTTEGQPSAFTMHDAAEQIKTLLTKNVIEAVCSQAAERKLNKL